jgi:hypothetical protein
MMTAIERAIQLALEAHRDQVDKQGKPYILHPLRVMSAMPLSDELAQIAAVLHDVLEDTNVMQTDMLKIGLPQLAVDAVDVLTRRPGELYKAYIARIGVDPLATRVKLADIEDNLRHDRRRPDTLTERYVQAKIFLTTGGSNG